MQVSSFLELPSIPGRLWGSRKEMHLALEEQYHYPLSCLNLTWLSEMIAIMLIGTK
jgi:hypothetical protein